MTVFAGDDIASLDDLLGSISELDRATARVALAAASLKVSGVWAADGALSMASWLEQHSGMAHRDATRMLREGAFLLAFPAVAEAAINGALSASKVAALRGAVSAPTRALFGEHQDVVVQALSGLNARESEVVAAAWKHKAEAVVEMPEPKVPERSWSSSQLPDGTTMGRFVFDALGVAELDAALQTAHAWDGPGDTRGPAVRSADAMVAILAFFNANHDSAATPRHRAHVELSIQASDPPAAGAPAADPLFGGCAMTAGGQLLATWATDSLLCDCTIHRLMRAGAAVLDYGRKTRTVPKSLWSAVAARDLGCRFPGCHRKKAWCDAHHIRWWRKHGETKLDNLLLLCAHHHHLVHKQAWVIALDADTAVVSFTTPDGRTLISEPRGVPTIRAA